MRWDRQQFFKKKLPAGRSKNELLRVGGRSPNALMTPEDHNDINQDEGHQPLLRRSEQPWEGEGKDG